MMETLGARLIHEQGIVGELGIGHWDAGVQSRIPLSGLYCLNYLLYST